jgi:hypothetical protein
MRLLRTLSVVVALGCPSDSTTRAQDVPPAKALQTARELAAVVSVTIIGDLVAKLTEQAWRDLEAELRNQFPAIDDTALAVLRRISSGCNSPRSSTAWMKRRRSMPAISRLTRCAR